MKDDKLCGQPLDLRPFEPTKNADQRRWLERMLGLPEGCLEETAPVASSEHPLLRRVK